MRIKAVLFAGLAQRLGVREEWLELGGAPRAADVFEHYRRRAPELGELGKAAVLAVNAEFCAPSAPLRDGDEVAILPPMSGGAPAVIETALIHGPLPPPPAWAPGAHGAVATFAGVVRGDADGRTVLALEYEAYETMAEARLRAIAEQAAARWPLLGLSIVHRLGRVEVGEASVRVVAAAAHRAAAFEACRFAIDELKRSAPIWKKEIYRDGEAWAKGELPEVEEPR
jgi:molybdopterin synthase catalytic subunit/molybdopterin converting factor small subunit